MRTPKAKVRDGFREYNGEAELSLCKKSGMWPDGTPLGKGHPQPCLQDHHASAIIEGRKTFEGRPGGGWLISKAGRTIAAGDYINFQLSKRRRLVVRVVSVHFFRTFDEMVQKVGVHRLLPDGELSISNAAELYRSFTNRRGNYRDLELIYGAVALEITPLVTHLMAPSLSPIF